MFYGRDWQHAVLAEWGRGATLAHTCEEDAVSVTISGQVEKPPEKEAAMLGRVPVTGSGDRQSDGKPGRSLRILVIEDDPLLGLLFSAVLADMGHKVCGTAVTESQAVTFALRERPELMIVDQKLLQGNGVAAVEQILRAYPCPHFFISGAETAPGAPGSVVLQKPFKEDDLARTIWRVMDAGISAAPCAGSC